MRVTPYGNESIGNAVELIEKANFSQAEKRQAYRNIVAKVAEHIHFNERASRALRNAQKQIENEKIKD